MNYDESINEIVVAIKGDKAIIQPWRNKAAARLEEAQAFVRMGKTSTNQRLIIGNPTEPTGFTGDACICPEGAVDKTCPVHG